MLYLFGIQPPKIHNAMGQKFYEAAFAFWIQRFVFLFAFSPIFQIRCILHFKTDTCAFEKASIPLHIERSSAQLKGNEDKAYHYIAKKQKWNYGTMELFIFPDN